MAQVQVNSHATDISSNELLSAKKTILSFNAAFKYYSLYPEGHAYSQNYLTKLKTDLDTFLEEYRKLRIDISKNSFIYKGETVFTGHAEESNPAFLLTRDRILFIDISEHVELKEITVLFDIFNKHRNPLEVVDGDIATSLWHCRFKHINYEAADIFAMEAIDFDLSMFKVVPGPDDPALDDKDLSSDDEESSQGRDYIGGAGDKQFAGPSHPGVFNGVQTGASSLSGGQGDTPPKSLLKIAKKSDLAGLTPEEQSTLKAYIEQEEKKNNASDVADILLIVLSIENNEIEFATILDFLEFEFFEAMFREDYFLAQKICRNVKNICQAVQEKKPWALPLINLFLADLAKEERLSGLPCINQYHSNISNPEKYKNLWPVLQLLPSEVMFTLGTLAGLTPISNLNLRNSIVDIIGDKAKDDPAAFTRLLEHSGEETNLLLFPVISAMHERDAGKVYLSMTHHPSPAVRRIGIDGFFQAKPDVQPEELYHLLGDTEKSLRQRVLSYIEQTTGGRVTEQILLSYLASDGRTTDDGEHVMNCYRLLSRCISPESIGFLRDVLLESKLSSMISSVDKTHKTGAACVLKSMGTNEGIEILIKGAQSMRPDVRNVCQKVLEQR